MDYNKLTRAELIRELEALRDSEEKFRSVFEYGADFIHIVDTDGTIMETNPATLKAWGYSREELVGRNLTGFLTSLSQEVCAGEFPAFLKRGCNRTDVQVSCKDGTIITVECSASTVYDEQGNIKYFVIIQRDITERTRVHEVLQLERDRLEMVAQNIGAGIAVISRDYRVVWANRILKDIFGNIEGKRCYKTLNQRTASCPGCCVKEIFKTGKERTLCEQIVNDRKGDAIHLNVIASPIKDEDGNITAALEMLIPTTGAAIAQGGSRPLETEEAVDDKWRELDDLKSEFVRFLADSFRSMPASRAKSERWLSLDEIAAYLGIKRDTVYKWIKRKKMPAHKVGSLWKFRQSEVDKWLGSGQSPQQ
jgi:PAS domain S-box-containing protein/excisionase family DNA binding protein